ncbi:disease resistance protein RGA2-like [Typha angustifolia]|uniref:disease resistance protein RGA2-like n=1 Tax=Typha angustifolia TaxID=59011 RepID=UPI003C2DF55B
MADLALTILQPLIERLSSDIWRQLGLLYGLKGDLSKLEKTLKNIKDALELSDKMVTTDERDLKRLWELKDMAYDAEDVLDDVQVEALRRSSSSSNRPITAEVHDFFSSKKQIAFRFEIAKKIKEINTRLNDILEAKEILKNLMPSNSEVSVHTEVASSWERETFSHISEKEEFYGRDDDRKKVMTFLLEKDNDKQLSVLPIVGLGGVGKTTLAKMVFNDERIERQFKPLIWVCVSENFKLREVIKKIIHNVKQEPYPLSELENMQRELVKIIGGKRFFLVLDDVWYDGDLKWAHQDFGWQALKSLISCGGSGSKVIVTTRDHKVASITGTLQYSHELKSLEFDDCWNLFCERAFGKKSPSPSWKEPIGKQIVEKCGGLPLAAKSLGGLMGSKQEKREWIEIRDSEIWEIKEEDRVHILPALRLSYLHFPVHLKQCFVYCSLFPKDYVFVMQELIELWITEGFISSTGDAGSQMHPKDIGSMYFRILLRQSFFQKTGLIRRGKYGEEIVEYTMHDLVHDLACFIAGPEFAFQARLTLGKPEKWRYLSIDLGGHLPEPERRGIIGQISKARKLRSFISVSPISEACYIEILSGLPYLRVLHLPKLEDKEVITALQNTIPRLKHLRLLHLLNSLIETLPEAITNLHSLQVLNLSYCYQLRKLPRDMSKLTNLRILDIDGTKTEALPPRFVGRLSKLEKLHYFTIGREPGRTIAELQQLNMLRGTLLIYGLAKVKDAEEAKKANLIAKTSLRHLVLKWEHVGSESDGSEERGNSGNIIDRMNSLVRSCCRARFASDKEEEAAPSPTEEDTIKNRVLDSLQPPPSLERLYMYSYDGTRFPSWMTRIELLSRYENLIWLYLFDIKRCEFLPPLGKLPCLYYLDIGEMPCLKQIGSEFYGDRRGGGVIFPSLKYLEIGECPNLTAWKEWLEPDLDRNGSLVAPSLRIVTIYGCPNLTALPEWLEVAPDSDTYHMVRLAGATYYRRRQCRVVAGETEDAATA